MKWKIIAIVFIAVAVTYTSLAQTKHALLIGIGSYPANSGWRGLSSANDLQYLKDALQLQGFAITNIVELSDERATRQGMQQTMQEFLGRLRSGDIVFFHFSGHGQQIEDDNGDEADGYDEALIPYDARARWDPVRYRGEKHFRDDALGEWLEHVRRIIGSNGSLMVVIDACHSGTATRSGEFAIVRGDPAPFARPGYKPQPRIVPGARKGSEGFFSASPLGTANMVVFSASSPNQVNYETRDDNQQGVGSLSYALALALQQLGADATYGDLFDRVKARVQGEKPQQIPMLEGNALQQVFAGNFLPSAKRMTIDRWITDTTLVVNLGRLHEIQEGAVLNLLEANSRKVVAKATVTESFNLTSTALVNAPIDRFKPYYVEVESYVSKGLEVRVKLSAPPSGYSATHRSLQQVLQNQPYITLSDPADFMVALNREGNQTRLELIEAGDAVRYTTYLPKGQSISQTVQNELLDQIKMGTRARYMRLLPDGGPLITQLKVSIYKAGASMEGDLVLKRGDEYRLLLENNSASRLYYTLINILPDNSLHVLIPEPDAEPADYSIGPGQNFPIELMVGETESPGYEKLRVIFSTMPIDIRPVLKGMPVTTRGSGGFEKLLEDVWDARPPQRITRSADNQEVTIVSAGFRIEQ